MDLINIACFNCAEIQRTFLENCFILFDTNGANGTSNNAGFID